MASNFIENRDENISQAKWAFIYIYGVVSIVLMACLFTNFYYYKGNEEAYARDERPIKAKVGMFVANHLCINQNFTAPSSTSTPSTRQPPRR